MIDVDRCRACNRHFRWLLIRWGRRLPFNYAPVPVGSVSEPDAWVPGMWTVYGTRQAAMSLLAEASAAVRTEAKQVHTIHRCPPLEDHIAAVFRLHRQREGPQMTEGTRDPPPAPHHRP